MTDSLWVYRDSLDAALAAPVDTLLTIYQPVVASHLNHAESTESAACGVLAALILFWIALTIARNLDTEVEEAVKTSEAEMVLDRMKPFRAKLGSYLPNIHAITITTIPDLISHLLGCLAHAEAGRKAAIEDASNVRRASNLLRDRSFTVIRTRGECLYSLSDKGAVPVVKMHDDGLLIVGGPKMGREHGGPGPFCVCPNCEHARTIPGRSDFAEQVRAQQGLR